MQKLFGLIGALSLAGCATSPDTRLATPASIDMAQVSGQWYVIANIPYFAERGRVGSRVIYRPREDGRYDDIFIAHRGDFDAPESTLQGTMRVRDPGTNTRWTSRFYWLFTFDYSVLHVDDGYRTLLLGHRSRDYAWIMSREPDMTEATYRRLLDVFAQRGFDVSKISRVPQHPAQIGAPGFQGGDER
jgi:apolipoprotein D and lipocalin family protein